MKKDLGPCPICGRSLISGRSIDRHHWVPKSRGGRDQAWVHKICHRKLHSLFTTKELRDEVHSPEAARQHPEMQAFLKWVRKQPPEYYDNSRTAKDWGRRR